MEQHTCSALCKRDLLYNCKNSYATNAPQMPTAEVIIGLSECSTDCTWTLRLWCRSRGVHSRSQMYVSLTAYQNTWMSMIWSTGYHRY